MKRTFPKRSLGKTNIKLPVLGFGGAPLGGLLQANDEAEIERLLIAAHKAGFQYYDTAPFYGFGRSERIIGDHVRGHDYILSTKVGRLLKAGLPSHPEALGWPDPLPFQPIFDYSYDGIMRSFEASQQRLGLDRVDFLLVHDIGEMTHGDAENTRHFAELKKGGYRALQELRSTGVVQAIGLGVNEIKACQDALEIGDWDVFLLAGRYTLLEQHALDGLLPECAARGVSIILGGPYNSGILVGGTTWNYDTAPKAVLERVAALQTCANDHHVPLPAAALQFPLAHPSVVSVIPGLRNCTELQQTLDWVQTSIPVAFWHDLQNQGLLHPDAPIPDGNPYEN